MDAEFSRAHRKTSLTNISKPSNVVYSDVVYLDSLHRGTKSQSVSTCPKRLNGHSTLDTASAAFVRPTELWRPSVKDTAWATVITNYATDFSDTTHTFKEIKNRIECLMAIAEDEGIKVSADSEKDLWLFLYSVKFTRRPYIALLDNGNFRAIWKNADNEQIGLQFRGCRQIQYVLFALRSPDRFMAQAAGRDTLQNVRRQIDAHDLWRLLN